MEEYIFIDEVTLTKEELDDITDLFEEKEDGKTEE